MPEGDTLFRSARTLQKAIGGATVTRFETGYAQLARVHDDAPITGRKVESVRAVGKHLLMEFTGGLTLRTHMRMNGSWHIYRPGEAWRLPRSEARIVVGTEQFVAVAFRVPIAEFEDARALRRSLSQLGPDLLSQDFDLEAAVGRVREAGAMAVAEALLRQRTVAGAGNVFKSEVLFIRRIHPATPAGSLSDEALRKLLETLQTLMRSNVIDGASAGIVTYTGFRRTTGRADPSERLWVYGRGGRPCRRCGTPIAYEKRGLDARSTYWCPRCQPAPTQQADSA